MCHSLRIHNNDDTGGSGLGPTSTTSTQHCNTFHYWQTMTPMYIHSQHNKGAKPLRRFWSDQPLRRRQILKTVENKKFFEELFYKIQFPLSKVCDCNDQKATL